MRYKKINLLILFLLAVGMMNISFAEGKGSNKSLHKVTAGGGTYYKMNINNIDTYIYNNGIADVIGSSGGFIYPKGSNRSAIYQSGFLWGGKKDGSIFVGGSTFTTGLVPGKIGQNPDDAQIFRVRPDYATGSMLSEMNDDEGSESAIREQYKNDWMNWPWQDGAPYLDADNNGKYEPDKDGNGKYDIGEDIPGVPGASQTIYYIANTNDETQAGKFYASPAVPIELHVTVWAYSTVGPLSNMIFKKYLFINKGTTDLTEMYCSAWNDPDNGNAGDDFVGVDSTLGMGYCYNAFATDQVYGSTPPATAFDFFQGPMVAGLPTDEAKSKGQKIKGYKNLSATAFYYFVNEQGTIYEDPTLDDYATGTLYFYNLLQGRIGATGEEFPIPEQIGGGKTHFPCSGDPLTQTGYVDGIIKSAADRRYGLASGPFTLAAGDEQEIVIAEIVAGATTGIDNLGALKLLKTYDAKAQDAYDKDFELPAPPSAPLLKTTALDQEIILNWGDDLAAVNSTENYNKEGYTFQGYNVYQLPSASATKEDAVRIATYDIVDGYKAIVAEYNDPTTGSLLTRVEQYGNDTGIKRSIDITNDYVNNRNLINGSKYYYAVTSYSYSPDPLNVPNNLENPLAIYTVIPQTPNPGVRYESKYGDPITVTKVGSGDGVTTVSVVDPSKVTGHKYKVYFTTLDGATVWNVKDVTLNKDVLTNFSNQSGDGNYPIIDGLNIRVTGPTDVGVKRGSPNVDEDPSLWGWDIPQGLRRFTWANGDPGDNFGLESFGNTAAEGGHGTLGYASLRWWYGDEELIVQPDELKNVELRLAKVDFTDDYNPPFDLSDPNMSYGYRFMRAAAAAAAKPEFAPFILNPVAGTYPFQEFAKNVPLSAWNVDDPANPKRLAVGFLENNTVAGLVDGKYWPGKNANITDNGLGTREWFFIFDEPYSETADPRLEATLNVSDARMMYVAMWNRRGTAYCAGGVSGDDVFAIFPNKPNNPNVSFEFTAPTTTSSADLAKQDVEKINVFPNPYYGANSQELNKYQRFVTFSHLPKNAVIRIFNLAGQLVKTITKASDSQFEKWDLLNMASLPVASGLYIAHIDMPDLGKTKILKLAIVQEQQILDRF